MSTSSDLTEAAVKAKMRFSRDRPHSKLRLDGFRLLFHAHTSVNMICVLCAKINIKKNAVGAKNLVINIVLGTKLWP